MQIRRWFASAYKSFSEIMRVIAGTDLFKESTEDEEDSIGISGEGNVQN